MSNSRFKQFAVSDSDEDSTDQEVIDRRERRSADDGSDEQAVVKQSLSPPSERQSETNGPRSAGTPTTPVVEAGVKQEETNHSSASFRVEGGISRNVTDGHSIKFESVPPTPEQPPTSAAGRTQRKGSAANSPRDGTSISFQSASASPSAARGSQPGTPRAADAARPAPSVPVVRGPGAVNGGPSAPPASSHMSTPVYPLEDGSNRPSPIEDGTPREDGTPGEDEKKKKKVVRRRVMRRRKVPDADAPGEVISDEMVAVARTASPAPPPPPRVSSRAARAASSHAMTPRSGSVEPRPRPMLPTNRLQTPRTPRAGAPATGGGIERVVAPLVPGRVATATNDGTPRSLPTHRSFADMEGAPTEAGSAAVPQPPSAKEVSRRTTPREADPSSANSAPSAGGSKAQTPELQVLPSARASQSPDTLDFQVDEESIAFQVGTTSSPLTASNRREQPSLPRNHRPQVPSLSALATPRSSYEMDDEGNVVRVEPARVRKQVKPDGSIVWVLVDEHRDDTSEMIIREIPAPPKRLSQRAQDIMAAKRRAVEQSAKRRRTAPKSVRRPRQRFNYPVGGYYSKKHVQRHMAAALAVGGPRWTMYPYDHQAATQAALSEKTVKDVRWKTEQVVRVLQPIQVAEAGTGALTGCCSCVVYASEKEAQLGEMLRSEAALEEGFKRYLNLQPMQLANVEMQDMTESQGLQSPAASRRASLSPSTAADARRNAERGLATLGGLWCTVEALREDGRPATRKDTKAPRRVMRVCGGPALGLPLLEEGQSLDVRCYELLLFSQESASPSAVNYGSEGLTLGQLISPPASSFPLTPRIVDDPILLKEYKRKLLATKPRAVAIQNSEDDRLTFFGNGSSVGSIAATPASVTGGAAGTPMANGANGCATAPTVMGGGGGGGVAAPGVSKYLTITLVTLNSRQKYTIDLTLVLLPYRINNLDGGKTLAEVPRFCPMTVATSRRLQGMSLSFSTRSSFMSAYRALLWATECNIIDIQPISSSAQMLSVQAGLPYINLRVSATPCPMLPWSSSLGKVDPQVDAHDTFHGNCVDFAVITLSASPTFTQSDEAGYRDPLTLDDFVIEEYNGGGAPSGEDEETASHAGGKDRLAVRRRSSIYTSTLAPMSAKNDDVMAAGTDQAAAEGGTTVVGLTSFGVIRRAVNQRTAEVFDVRVLPRNRARMCPAFDEASSTIKTAKVEEEQLLQQDVEAAIMMEYTSRLPFLSRVYGVLVDEQRYYVFQEPWISALALQQSAVGSAERNALEYNPVLKSISDRTSVMSLKEFIHGVLRPQESANGRESAMSEEARLQIAQVLIGQLMLLITSIHGKGTLLGPCPPHRLLVRVETPASPEDEDQDRGHGAGGTYLGHSEEPTPTKQSRPKLPAVTSKNVQLCVLNVGVNTHAWSYERQQCGVLEYVAPSYAFEYMLGQDIGKESRAWTMRDDWWSFLCVCFELLAGDGSALVRPKVEPATPTPTPIISKFSSPVDILSTWKEVLTNKDVVGNTVNETVAARVQAFVRARVLESVSPSLDSWIVNKYDELEFFGTTAGVAGRRKRFAASRAVPPADGPRSKVLGISLASVYFNTNRDTPSNASDASGFQFDEEADAATTQGENILKEMPWLFHYRDLFDSILGVVFPAEDDHTCAVHGPSMQLLSHPFFSALDLGQVFDGTHELPRAASHVVRTRLTKERVRDALVKYRVDTYRGPLPKRPEYPLMITGSAFNMGSGNSAAPLLLLTSPAYRDELSAREMEPPLGDGGAFPWHSETSQPQEGLVCSPSSSSPPSMVPSPRARSPAAGQGVPPHHSQQQQSSSVPWGQQGRLRAMYKNEELQSIAQLENEVRGALYSHTARDSVVRREVDLPAAAHSTEDTARQQQQQHQPTGAQMSITNENGSTVFQFSAPPPPQPHAHAQTVGSPAAAAGPSSAHSASRRTHSRGGSVNNQPQRDPSAYEHVSTRSSVLAPPADELQQEAVTNPYVTNASVHRDANALIHRGTPRELGGSHNSQPIHTGSNRNLDYDEIERSLNELAANPYGRGRRDSKNSQSGRWPNELLSTANLDKKGTPMKLSDPLIARCLDDDNHRSSRTGGPPRGAVRTPRRGDSFHSGSNVVVAQERPARRGSARRTSSAGGSRHRGSAGAAAEEDQSVVLVPSDDEDESTLFVPRHNSNGGGHGSTYQSNIAGNDTPTRSKRAIPAWRRASVDDRDSYFEF